MARQMTWRTVAILGLGFLAAWAVTAAAGEPTIFDAIKTGDTEKVRTMLNAPGANVELQDPNGATPLMYASAFGRLEIAELLVAKGAQLNAKDHRGFTPLNAVVRDDSSTALEMTGFLIDHGADVNAAQSNDHRSLLLSATAGGLPKLMQLLLDKGANVNAGDINSLTPLHVAATQYITNANGKPYNPQLVSILLSKGADPNAKNSEGQTPLHSAASAGRTDAVRLLLAAGASVDAPDRQGNTPLHYAHNKDIDALLLARGASLSAKNRSGETPLFTAVSWAEQGSLEYLLSKGADITATANGGATPLHVAAAWDKPDAVVFLINKGIDVNAKDEQGQTPLFQAVAHKHLDIVQLLLTRGADVNLHPQDGTTPLHVAVNENATDIAKLLIANGADVRVRDRGGFTPLDKLTTQEATDLLSARKGGATPAELAAAKTPSSSGNSVQVVNGIDLGYSSAAPVIAAARAGREEPLVYALRQPGLTDLNALLQGGVLKKHPEEAQNGNGYDNILVLAIKYHRDDALELLLDGGVDPNIPDQDKYSGNAITVAVSGQGSIAAEKLLLERGASPNSIREMGSDWVIAMRNSDERKVEFEKYELLLRHGMNPTNTLDSVVWDFAQAQKRPDLFCGMRVCPVTSRTVEDLASTAERGGDAVGAAFLRHVYTYQTATSCPSGATVEVLETCLPAALTHADKALDQRYQEQLTAAATPVARDTLHSSEVEWLSSRDKTCQLAYPWSNRDGWLSYVLTDTTRASCVLDATNKRIAALGGSG